MARRAWIAIGMVAVCWPGPLFAQVRLKLPDVPTSLLTEADTPRGDGGQLWKTPGTPLSTASQEFSTIDPRPLTHARSGAPPGAADPAPPQTTSIHDPRAQYPKYLANSYFGINVGFLHYPFSSEQMEPGNDADSVRVGHVAGQVVLIGHHFNEYFSAQAGYTRPVRYVTYVNVNNTGSSRTVWMAFAEFMVRARVPVNERVAIYGNAGLAMTSRRGFRIGSTTVVKDAQYASMVVGAGLEYRLNPSWDVLAGVTRVPTSLEDNQPRTLFLSGGIRYNLRPLPVERVERNSRGGFGFPENVLQIGFTTSAFGYGINQFFASRFPIFWGGRVEVARGWSLHYQRNIFHTEKLFSFDVGASAAQWKSRKNGEKFLTLSVYPLLRLTFWRTPLADWFLSYSVAGPSRMTRKVVDDQDTGTNRFTFQDFMGMGVFAGKDRNVMIGIKIVHYSNGNLFPRNAGVAVPLTFTLGYTF
ncbi:MAG TPA: acyloxyacyl hydrolase [Vicinamibacterales bacterium]|nr:acyloxyacyl hydrolase [Vicinamibacterales bacterium]